VLVEVPVMLILVRRCARLSADVKTFYLLDGHAQVFRAYYAPFRPLTSPSGEPVKAVHVFTQLLLNILHKERPDYLAIAFDVADATTERRADYEPPTRRSARRRPTTSARSSSGSSRSWPRWASRCSWSGATRPTT
jgi:5'-3' exonuclease